MIEKRPFLSFGSADHGWLNAHHHFSFAEYRNPARMGWGKIRVWNDDEIKGGAGFPPHPHVDMEIITYVREGAVTHEDSLGNKGRTEAGSVQVMSAGSGIRHAEYNADHETIRLFQIWLLPRERGGEPYWNMRDFPKGDRSGKFIILASGYGEDGALPIRADGRVLGATVKAGETVSYDLPAGSIAYLVPSTGAVEVNGVRLDARDAAAIKDETRLTVKALEDSELVMVETE